MRRAPFVVGATGVGLGLLLSFHTKAIHVSNVSAAGTGSGGTGSSTTPPTGGTTPSTGGTGSRSGGTTPTTSGSPSSAPATPATTPAPTSTTTGVRSASGQDIQYRYGDIQLKVTERGTTITDIQVLQEGATDPRSAEINSQAVPMLQQQAMSVQSANIDGVSGATFTSLAYQDALQSALDQLR